MNDRPYLELPIPRPLYEDLDYPQTKEVDVIIEDEEESEERVIVIQL